MAESEVPVQRRSAPSLKVMESQEEITRERLLQILISSDNIEAHPVELNKRILLIKEHIRSFEEASRLLSTWLSDRGSLQKSHEVRSERISIVHRDARESVKNLNKMLASLGEDVSSEINSVPPSEIIQKLDQGVRPKTTHPQQPSKPISEYSDPVHQSVAASVPPIPLRVVDPTLPRNILEPPGVVNMEPSIQEELLEVQLSAVSLLPREAVDEVQLPGASATNQISSLSNIPSDDVDHLDPISRRQLKQDLLKGMGDPYGGEPEKFWSWQKQIARRLLECEAGALDSLYILIANTNDRPKKLVSTYLDSCSGNPGMALQNVWRDLKIRFGSSSLVSQSLVDRVDGYPYIKSVHQVRQMEELFDLCMVIRSSMEDCPELTFFNLQRGMKTIYTKLPDSFQSRWRKEWFVTESKTGCTPSFSNFVDFLQTYLQEIRTPGFFEAGRPMQGRGVSRRVESFQTRVEEVCAFHGVSGHNIRNCFSFKKLTYPERKSFAKSKRLCYSCLGDHVASSCPREVSCDICSQKHCNVMHSDRPKFNRSDQGRSVIESRNNCIKVCGDSSKNIICSKTLLVYVRVKGAKPIRCLCILDDQSNSTFCDTKLLDYFNLKPKSIQYNLTTMNGLNTTQAAGSVRGLQVKGISETKWINLPETLTHSSIPDTRDGMATSTVVASHPHVRHLASNFPESDPDAEVLLLVGANCGPAMTTKVYGSHYPYVHRTPLGWSLVGPVCSKSARNNTTTVLKTTSSSMCEHSATYQTFPEHVNETRLFLEREDDDFEGLSRSDRQFNDIMAKGIITDENGNIQLPLPLKEPNTLPDNKAAVFQRTRNTLNRIKRDSGKTSECLKIMGKYLKKGHVTQVPVSNSNLKANYIPIFAVSSKFKTRLVFDSSASYHGKCLNDVLHQGPDINNKLLGVLMRFREGQVGYCADIECMYHSFYVQPEHRELLRFFWWKNNNPEEVLVPYRANVHIFGNCCSPAVAIYGLRYVTTLDHAACTENSSKFIRENFYVDDALGASATVLDAVELLDETRKVLSRFNIRLHKIASNDSSVLGAFPRSEISDASEEVQFSSDKPYRTLGVIWNTVSDTLMIKFDLPTADLTRRGVLSMVNSIYDPLGIVSPIVLGGKLLLRRALSSEDENSAANGGKGETKGWDDPLEKSFGLQWRAWSASLVECPALGIPRNIVPSSCDKTRVEIHVFCDASVLAIGLVVYLKTITNSGDVSISFLFSSAKVAPRAACTIPRLELNAAVEAAKCTFKINKEISIPIDLITFHSDSKIVLGYISNTTKRFSNYVTNRVHDILKLTRAEQWVYVSTRENPADLATKPQTPVSLSDSMWFVGPEFLQNYSRSQSDQCDFEVDLPELLPDKRSLITQKYTVSILENVFQITNDFCKAQRIVQNVLKFCIKLLSSINRETNLRASRQEAIRILIIDSQRTSFPESYRTLNSGSSLNEKDKLVGLAAFMDHGVIRVGGRLRNSSLPFAEKHPALLPSKHAVTYYVLSHYHERAYHQGRHITMGALQQEGYHILHSRNTVRDFLSKCVQCRRFRAPLEEQMMSDLPSDRIEMSPPFTHTGIDAFGPYLVHDGATTRRLKATKKVWPLLFTCLVTRAVHIEILAYLDSASVHLALRRFFAIRGQCRRLRSDHGSNFVGARSELLGVIDEDCLRKHVESMGLTWEMTTPAASHTGGVWERKVGAVKSVLNSAMQQLGSRSLSRCELNTLLQECSSIVNNTPLYEVSGDPNDPVAITPAMILTLKSSSNPAPVDQFSKADLLSYGRSRWRRVMYLSEQFWVMWRRLYLQNLQRRNKWLVPKRPLQVNDVVLLRQPSPRNSWPLARVIKTEEGADGLVRTVTLRVSPRGGKTTVLRRSIQDTLLLVPAVEEGPSI